MKNLQTVKGFAAGALLMLGLLLGLSTVWAQFGTDEESAFPPGLMVSQMARAQFGADTERPFPPGLMVSQMARSHGRDFGLSHRPGSQDDHLDALAEALGVTVEELEAAHTAVAEGQHTARLEALAEQLNITVAELEAAQATVREAQQAARLAEMVASGQLTEEQAALMQAHQAVRSYLDVDGMEAAVQAFWQTAIDDALAAGDITAEQAEELTTMLSERDALGLHNGHGRGQGMNNGNNGRGRGQGMNNGNNGRGLGHGRGFNQP